VRSVFLPGTDIETSAIGMGCASLGSRISPTHGRRMLDMAFAHGVRWFDVAPAYGAGRAEEALAPFLAAHRDGVYLCSKVGLSPPSHNGLVRAVYAAGRPVIGLAQGLRRRFRSIKATRNVRVPLTAELIETSLQASLARLGTDYLDVFALHDPDPADLDKDEVLSMLDTLMARGLIRHVSIAGTFEAARKATDHGLFSFVQMADDAVDKTLSALRQMIDRPLATITHSVFGVGGARDALIARLKADKDLQKSLADAGYEGTPDVVATNLLMRRAFASNPDGVVLASMYTADHLQQNTALASQLPDPQSLTLCDSAFAAPAGVRQPVQQDLAKVQQ